MRSEVYQSVLEHIPLAVLVVDESNQVEYANHAFERLSGVVIEALRGKKIHNLSHLRAGGAPLHLVDGRLEPAWHSDASWTNPDGDTTSIELEIKSLDGGGTVLLLHPVGGAEARDRRRERMESLGRLTGGIAHDLNNILTGILGHISYLHWALPPDGNHGDSVKAVEDGARRAATLLHQILEFAKGEQGKHGSVNMTQLVEAAHNLFRAALPKNIQTTLSAEDEELAVLGDEGQLSQLVMNLAVNARDALPNGGLIEIALSRATVENSTPGSVILSSASSTLKAVRGGGKSSGSGRFIRLSVRDTGTGIPKHLQSKIFEPFFTTKAAKGTGLGLANVAAITQAHGGMITIESEPDRGTLFEVYIPECSEAAEAGAQEKAHREALPTGGERILVVEDEETVRTVMQRCLEHLGYEVEVAEDGPEALDLYRQSPLGTYCLVILDMMMPKMSGDEVFSALRALDPSVRVLISSGYSTDGRAQSVIDAGGMGFIPKPFAIEDLAREVRRCLDR